MDDEEWIEAEMDEYFHQQPEEEYIDPSDYSYVDPQTGLTPKQQAYLDYQQAWDDYEPIGLALHIWIELKIRRNGKTFGANLISL